MTRVRPADLRKLRRGQTVSMFGDEVTKVALPTIALLVLQATPFQFGLLSASTYLPYPVFGLLVGAWVDRVRRRRVLLLADAARFAAIVSVPVAILTGTLTMAHLFAVGLVVGTASVFFNSAYQAYLPSIVRSDEITTANAKLSVSETSASVGGPPLAGILISATGAAGAMILDAGSYLVSIASLTFIRRPEPDPGAERSGQRDASRTGDGPAAEDRPSAGTAAAWRLAGGQPGQSPVERRQREQPRSRSLLPDVVEGLHIVFGDRLLRSLTLTSALSNLGRGMALQLFLLFAYNGLQVSPGVAGFMLATGNIGALLGSMTCNRVTARLGLGPTLVIASILKGLPWVLAPLTLLGGAIPISVAIMIASSYFVPISNVTTLSMRQSLVSRQVQGRVAATTRTVTRTIVPLSAILGGTLAQVGTSLFGRQAGLAGVLALGGVAWMGATVLLPRDQLRRLRSLADLEAEKNRGAQSPDGGAQGPDSGTRDRRDRRSRRDPGPDGNRGNERAGRLGARLPADGGYRLPAAPSRLRREQIAPGPRTAPEPAGRDRDWDWNRDRDRNRDWNRDWNQERDWNRDRDRDWNQERDRDRDWERDRNQERDRDRALDGSGPPAGGRLQGRRPPGRH